MNNKLIYYRLSASKKTDIPLAQGYRMKVFYPSAGRLNLHTYFKPIYLFWYLFTFARYSIYYVYDVTGRIIHFSHVMPKIFKYAFMPSKNSIHIGPCWTNKNHRGKGIYPAVLSKICADHSQKDVYIGTDDDNISSQRGIEKVGFKRFATGYKTRYLGIYKTA
jgi:RimJ/RimL family protein N-acetyltransferase